MHESVKQTCMVRALTSELCRVDWALLPENCFLYLATVVLATTQTTGRASWLSYPRFL